ncbi:hypothetical protein TN53_18970 [Streptomyces sp. WM6386]|nr:hypothetical protein TN53_18970 [Streptomyces sp. WM6386]
MVLPLFAVLTLHAGATELGILRAVGQAPILLLSLFVGAWGDRWRTRTVMVLTDVGRTSRPPQNAPLTADRAKGAPG